MSLDTDAFREELPGWVLRGALCAAASAFWAGLMGFQAPAEIAGMAAGVGFWVALFAAACARWRARRLGPRAVAALKAAAWIKFALTIVAVPVLLADRFLPASATALAAGAGFDMMLGFAALWLVSQLSGLPEVTQIAQLDSFGWTALATVIEGALMAVVIAVMAGAILVWWQVGPRLFTKPVFPPASAGT